ncbi:hypothetical protein BCON_0068g00430 [Botryotinia convoluta]|uniref:Uncharacterized protein n=1 Tax=Botryotinia convoluta TaxID=54673 RepID=A0A4Z1ICE8_9HELO|nr:hypothetical protein BCON_0068g00430 [Botryotinia convoluta]
MEILGLSIKTNSEAHKLTGLILLSLTTYNNYHKKDDSLQEYVKKRTGDSEEALIEQFMAMDSTSVADFEDKDEDMLSAIRKSRSRLRKLNENRVSEKDASLAMIIRYHYNLVLSTYIESKCFVLYKVCDIFVGLESLNWVSQCL